MDISNSIMTGTLELPSEVPTTPELSDLLRKVLVKDPFERIMLQVGARATHHAFALLMNLTTLSSCRVISSKPLPFLLEGLFPTSQMFSSLRHYRAPVDDAARRVSSRQL